MYSNLLKQESQQKRFQKKQQKLNQHDKKTTPTNTKTEIAIISAITPQQQENLHKIEMTAPYNIQDLSL